MKNIINFIKNKKYQILELIIFIILGMILTILLSVGLK
jgi:hypothetical protein